MLRRKTEEARKSEWDSGRWGERKEAKVILASPVYNWAMITSGGSRQFRIQSSLDM